jgi:hypothetical protein
MIMMNMVYTASPTRYSTDVEANTIEDVVAHLQYQSAEFFWMVYPTTGNDEAIQSAPPDVKFDLGECQVVPFVARDPL